MASIDRGLVQDGQRVEVALGGGTAAPRWRRSPSTTPRSAATKLGPRPRQAGEHHVSRAAHSRRGSARRARRRSRRADLDLREPGRDGGDRALARVDIVVWFRGDWRRHRAVAIAPHGVGAGDRVVPRVLVVVDEHLVGWPVLAPPRGGGVLRDPPLDLAGELERGLPDLAEFQRDSIRTGCAGRSRPRSSAIRPRRSRRAPRGRRAPPLARSRTRPWASGPSGFATHPAFRCRRNASSRDGTHRRHLHGQITLPSSVTHSSSAVRPKRENRSPMVSIQPGHP